MVYSSSQIHIGKLGFGDPLLYALNRASNFRIWRVYLLSLASYAVLIVGVGVQISGHYEHIGLKFMSLLNPQEFFFTCTCFLFIVPLIWSFYVWQPKGFFVVEQKLRENGVIGGSETEDKVISEFMYHQVIPMFTDKRFLTLASITILTSPFIWLTNFTRPNVFNPGNLPLWWSLNPVYKWAIFMPLAFVNVYMTVWILCRQVIIVRSLSRLLRQFYKSVRLFHPDNCNGLAPIGHFATKLGSGGIIFGFWLSAIIGTPVLFGYPPNLKWTTLLGAVCYIIMIPTLLIPPIWEAHLIMLEYRDRTLENLGQKIHSELMSDSVQERGGKGLVEVLEWRYSLLERELHLWPVRVGEIKRFIVATTGPIISSVIPIVLNRILK